MGTGNKIAVSMETTTRVMKIQATKVVLMELVITVTSLDISKQIAIRNRGMNKKISMKLAITGTILDISKKIATRNKGMNKQISQRTKNEQKLF